MHNSALRLSDSADCSLDLSDLKNYAEGWFLPGEISQHSAATLENRRLFVKNLLWFKTRFDELRQTKGLWEDRDISLRKVAEETGLSFNTLQQLRKGETERLTLREERQLEAFRVGNTERIVSPRVLP